MKTTFFYDEQNDDFFSGKNYDGIIDHKYKYISTHILKQAFDFVLYYFVAFPILWAFLRICGVQIKDKKNIKALKSQGFFVFGNHTNPIDAFVVQVAITFPKRTYIVCQSNTQKIPFLKHLTKSLGALPIGQTFLAQKNFDKATKHVLAKKSAIVVFPEAHIWPHYTGVRPLNFSSFKLASKNKMPIVPIAVTYRKSRFSPRPKTTIFVGTPVFFDTNLSINQNAKIYFEHTFNFLKTKTSQQNYLFHRYIKVQKKHTQQNEKK